VAALVEVDLALVERARATCEEALTVSRAGSHGFWTLWTLGVLGRLELALGDLDAAAYHLRELPAQLLERGLNDPASHVWADAIETLVALGELDRARMYLERWETYGARLGGSWVTAGALRCRGLLAAAEGDQPAALAAFERALSDLEGQPYPFERGRTLLCVGIVQRQAQQRTAARGALEQALAIFEALGARLWSEKARAELRRISGRRPADAELTETEHRVAALASAGRSNKEIAAELFMGLSTVEAHLSRVYRKLGVRSRAGLASRLVVGADEPAQT
jgi:DNA-binding CsgD family transcriptional regulator